MRAGWTLLGLLLGTHGIAGTLAMAAAPRPDGGATTPPAATAPGSRPLAVPVLPDDRLGIRTAPLLLLSRADIRADLQLNDQQTASALRTIADLHARALALRSRPANDPTVAQGRKAVDDAQRAWIAANLSEAQRDRLLQVDLQWEGPTAVVSRPLVAETLELTPDQRATIDTAVKQHQAARAAGTATRAEVPALTRTVLNVLTPAQRDRWRAMLGREFVLQTAAAPGTTPTTTR